MTKQYLKMVSAFISLNDFLGIPISVEKIDQQFLPDFKYSPANSHPWDAKLTIPFQNSPLKYQDVHGTVTIKLLFKTNDGNDGNDKKTVAIHFGIPQQDIFTYRPPMDFLQWDANRPHGSSETWHLGDSFFNELYKRKMPWQDYRF